jgi:8-oxo-dGTP pyrophosphatase MutT (NUDIX family)
MNQSFAELVEQADGKKDIKLKFLNRLEEGKLSRAENPVSHLCVYFAAYDPSAHKVFIGHHRKSGLWLFNGGHMDPNETPADTIVREAKEEWGKMLSVTDVPSPQLVTLTEIEHPEQIVCEWHYDLWCFLPFDSEAFHPDEQLLLAEFMQSGWKSYEEAETLLKDPASREALDYVRSLR